MAVMLLVNNGQLRLDDRVRDILPDFPAYGRDIVIRHLLSHTSGLRAYQDFLPESPTRQVTDRDVLTLLHRTDTLLFPPGSAFRYGDSGYAILALVVEAVSGVSFARFLHGRIFARIGMKSTVAYEPGVSVVSNRALGYLPTPTGFRASDQSNTSTVLGDGGVYSSVRDLIAWDRSLDDDRLVDLAKSIRMVFPLYNEEVHILGRGEISDFDQLAGKRVAIGQEGSGTYLTARLLFKLSEVRPREIVPIEAGEALAQLKAGRIDAMFYVAGYPIGLLRDDVTAEDGFTLIPIASKSILESYDTVEIPATAYRWQPTPVSTVAVKAILVSFVSAAGTVTA